jgi:hypothetical protein
MVGTSTSWVIFVIYRFISPDPNHKAKIVNPKTA